MEDKRPELNKGTIKRLLKIVLDRVITKKVGV